jgi:hypothetical protein
MDFHHVLLTLTEAPSKLRCVLADLSEDQLKRQFLRPYRKGKNILCGNQVIQISSIRSVQIIRTKKTSERELSELQDRSFKEIQELNRQSESVVIISPGRGYNAEDIVETGEDITSQHIIALPGHGTSGILQELLRNQWVVAIGTGLIVAALVWWFGWGG